MLAMEIWLRLAAVSRLGAEQASVVAEKLKTERDVSRERLLTVGMTDAQAGQFLQLERPLLDRTLRWLEQPGHHALVCADERYPHLLRHIAFPPKLLFVVGEPELLASAQVAVVGSRDNSLYGEQWGQFFAQELALNGIVVTSGLAVGIDGIAYRAALGAGGRALAVLGSGLEHIYPRRHRKLAERILERGGALVSEYPVDAAPLPHHFLHRNRIISGLSLGVLVVETSLRSGSLVTARHALEQNREVFALPVP